MTALYLITGFLGSGKTTFLKEFAGLFDGQKLAVLVNEFGKADVDSKLLKDLQARIEEIHNGSIFCSCRIDQFEQALIKLASEDMDTILVETSGLSDPTDIRRILSDSRRFGNIHYEGCVCLADAYHFEKVFYTAVSTKKQLEASDAVLINKTDLAPNTDKVHEIITNFRPGIPVFETSYGRIQKEWLDKLCRPIQADGLPSIRTRDLSIQSYLITIRDNFPFELFVEFLNRFAGETYRIKGFVNLNGVNYIVDCVRDMVKVTGCGISGSRNQLVVLAGQGMKALPAIRKAAEEASAHIVSIEIA